MIWWLIAALVVAGIAALPFWLESRRGPPDAPRGGEILDLPQGDTYREWHGPSRGARVVAIHGLTTPSPVWGALAAGLGRLGYRTLTYDHLGRGASDNPAEPQDADHYVRHLHDLLGAEGLVEDVTLIGYSMGASVAVAYAAAHPERIKRVILLAPAGIVTPRINSSFAVRWRGIGDWYYLATEPARFRAELRHVGRTPAVPDLPAVMAAQTRRRGFFPSILASRRGILSGPREAEHRKLAKDGVPLVAIWAAQDEVIPLSGLGRLAEWNRAAKQEVVAGAGHGLPYTHSDEVLALLSGILQEP
ncbi:alpha/beta fold hydrolase [Wenxinia marina]|uniref:Putative hydrolase or acyltransferase (Alpha/beta hydrolase superfamily) n=1 Tax=Wenxinia marina DSM 24838 TaxID=1123501 RepID=A0A0D0QG33_9RHOB|nr:alpha/beta fold hydrolase [Wenxinia marina]KIQ70003.1 putative hydrolase or acyltransferase (alpha/beta hydrolase superfamily) [Wenxinia marina DSM 24838]GGL62777.1 hypothetical protein GCM10011392_16780 [Wenxinia marina]